MLLDKPIYERTLYKKHLMFEHKIFKVKGGASALLGHTASAWRLYESFEK